MMTIASQGSALEKLAPQAQEAEQSVLGSILIDADAILRVAEFLRPADFYRAAHGTIYEAMLSLHGQREPIDLVTLAEELERRDRLEAVGGPGYLATLMNAVPTAVHVEHYGRIVERKSVLRNLIAAAGRIAAVGYEEANDAEVAIDRGSRSCSRSASGDGGRLRVAGTLFGQAYDRLEYLHEHRGQILGIPSGLSGLDALLGGFQPSDLVILAARPSVGKTSLALNIAQHAAVREGKRVAVFSLEMSREQLALRLLSAETGINPRPLQTGFVDETDWSKIARVMNEMHAAPMWIDDSPALSVMELRTKARRLEAEQHGMDLIIVDYLQLMQAATPSRDGNRVQEVSEISRGPETADVGVPCDVQSGRLRRVGRHHVPLVSRGLAICQRALRQCTGPCSHPSCVAASVADLGREALSFASPRGMALVLPRGIVLLLAVLAGLTFLVEGAILDWSALLLLDRNLVDSTQGGLGYMLFSIAMTVGRLTGDQVVAALGARRVLFWGGLLTVGGFVLLLTVRWTPALLGFVLIGLGASNIVPVLFSLAGRQTVMPAGLAVAAVTRPDMPGFWRVQLRWLRLSCVKSANGLLVTDSPHHHCSDLCSIRYAAMNSGGGSRTFVRRWSLARHSIVYVPIRDARVSEQSAIRRPRASAVIRPGGAGVVPRSTWKTTRPWYHALPRPRFRRHGVQVQVRCDLVDARGSRCGSRAGEVKPSRPEMLRRLAWQVLRERGFLKIPGE